MGKPQRAKPQRKQQAKKGKKKPQYNRMKSDDQEEVDDVMAWGKKRQNYYRQDEDEYSSLSEEQKEAQQIYNSKYDNYLNDEEAYDIPVEKEEEKTKNKKDFEAQFDQNVDQEQTLPEEYVSQQLQWVLELFKDFEFYEDNQLLKIYNKLLKSYLTVIISIKELKIPYIQYHPIIPMAVDIKAKITQLMKKLTVKDDEESQPIKNNKSSKNKKALEQSSQDDEDEEIEDLEDAEIGDSEQQGSQGQEQWSASQQNIKDTKPKSKSTSYPDHCSQATKTQKQEHKKGLQFYEQMKNTIEQQKKQKKQQKRGLRQQKKKPAFKQIGQNEGRFASQLILKNKGLIKKRKKIEGNSRLKLRKKYQKKKAIHRARSGHFIRENPGRAYEGESNIRTGKIAGVRLK